jgi:hypothetical protein
MALKTPPQLILGPLHPPNASSLEEGIRWRRLVYSSIIQTVIQFIILHERLYITVSDRSRV